MPTLFAIFGMPGGYEIVILGVVILLLFGSARLPSLMRNLGRSGKEFQKGMRGEDDDDLIEEDESK